MSLVEDQLVCIMCASIQRRI